MEKIIITRQTTHHPLLKNGNVAVESKNGKRKKPVDDTTGSGGLVEGCCRSAVGGLLAKGHDRQRSDDDHLDFVFQGLSVHLGTTLAPGAVGTVVDITWFDSVPRLQSLAVHLQSHVA